MRSVSLKVLCASAAVLFVVALGRDVQGQQAPAKPDDPRIGLKGGLTDAGEAAWNMERLSGLSRPSGFFDPDDPAGPPTPAERAPGTPPPAPPPTPPAGEATAPRRPGGLDFANSDIAFRGTNMFLGNFHGFNVYDIENTTRPQLLASIVCPGGQGDVSVYGNLLFMSVEQTRGRIDCGTQGVTETVSAERFRGIRIFDISDMKNPKQVAAVQTCRGSHTHTLVPNPKDPANLYVYGQGTGQVRPGEELEGCVDGDQNNPDTALFSIDVIKVPLASPQDAAIVNRPRIFADPNTGNLAGLWQGGDHGPGTQTSRMTNQCHDITVFPEVGLAAGACSGNGILMDISDPVHPKRLDHVADGNFAYWHSATFNNDGTKVIFTDEWGGGTRPRCRATDPKNWGADAIFDIVDGKLKFGGYFKMPAPQTEQENCVAHNGSLIPVPGRDIMVQAWYQGGLSVFDFTDAAHPVEIAFFDRGPIDPENLKTGGYWSTYWYNGNIYGSEIARGMDVFRLLPSEYLTRDEIDAAVQARTDELNVQDQQKVSWPATSVVARAYLDQLRRSNAITAARNDEVRAALARVDGLRSAQDNGAAAAVQAVEGMATAFDRQAASASGRDKQRLAELAQTLRGRVARLR
ncbi:MAG: LVIVD repeat-containing protein [Vicinamibacterales bacterium]